MDTSIVETKQFVSHIIGGRHLEYNFLENISLHNKQLKILHHAFPSVLFQRKKLALHGCAFEYKNYAILLLGPSGYGKSETINVLQKHLKVISDDIISIEIREEKAICNPGLPILCIQNKNSALKLNDKRERSLQIVSHNNMVNADKTVKKILYLDWGEENIVSKMKTIDAFKYLILNSFRPIPSTNSPDSQSEYMKLISHLANTCQHFRLSRKKGDLDGSISTISNFLKNND